MRGLRSLLAAAALAVGLVASPAVRPAVAETAQDAPVPAAQKWSFSGILGTVDLASAQRGFQVYSEVCAVCHSMRQLHYRDLTGLGLTMDQVKAIAASFTVPQGFDDQGAPREGPATPASQFRSPYPNEKAARATNNGSLPPDLSLIVNAREFEADYVFGLLTGYADPPASMKMQDGMNYNKIFPGHQIGMPRPLQDGQVTFADGTANTTEQMSRDVVTFLMWAANPEMTERKQIGSRVILFLILLTGVTYCVKRKIWSDVH